MVSHLALVSRMASDISGKEGDEQEFVTLVIREHPSADEPRALDVMPDEIAGLKAAADLVALEIRKPDSTVTQLVVPLADFRKVVKDETVSKGRSLRGRRPGLRLGNGN